MATRAIGKLTTKTVAGAGVGLHGDGGNLWLQVGPSGRSWIFRFKSPITGREREMGLGASADLPLAKAREAATAARILVRGGRDPLAEKHAAAQACKAEAAPSFKAAAQAYIAAHEAGWRNAKHGAQWSASLEQHVFPTFGEKRVDVVDRDDVLHALEPIWTKVPETATRLRGRIELVLGYATAKGWRTGDNPARWRGHLAHMLPRRSKVAPVEHHAALSFKRMGEVMDGLATARGVSALALRFLVLTAARSSEVRNATWSEIDLVEKVWTVPAARMKGGREHRVPLSDEAIAVLEAVVPLRDIAGASDYVFPGGRRGAPLSDVSLSKALHLASGADDVTVHGLRSTFRDWCGEATAFPGDVAEAALAHAIRDKVEAAYRRGDLFEKRRRLMEAWGAFATLTRDEARVIPIRRGA